MVGATTDFGSGVVWQVRGQADPFPVIRLPLSAAQLRPLVHLLHQSSNEPQTGSREGEKWDFPAVLSKAFEWRILFKVDGARSTRGQTAADDLHSAPETRRQYNLLWGS